MNVVEPFGARAARHVVGTLVRAGSMLDRSPLPRNDRGDELDADVAAYIRVVERRGKFDPRVAVGRLRYDYDALGPIADVPRRPMARIEPLTIDGPVGPIRARLYVPRERRELRPGLVWLHGGGFVIGSLRSHDHALRAIAADADVPVLAIDYRLGPEHRFPAAHDDALAAMRWALREAASLGLDPDRLAIGGDSAGANLATATCIALRDAGDRLPKLQVLVYPVTDPGHDSASKTHLAQGYILTKPLMDWFMAHYMRTPADLHDPRLAVRHAKLEGLPKAIVTTAGFDPLRDEGDDYATALAAAGVRVERRPEPRLVHSWITLGGAVPEAARAVRSLALAIRGSLGG